MIIGQGTLGKASTSEYFNILRVFLLKTLIITTIRIMRLIESLLLLLLLRLL
jgi:hypothetical protein